MLRALFIAVMFVAGSAHATDVVVRWTDITTDDQGKALPAGTKSYLAFQSTDGGATYSQVGAVDTPPFVRKNVAPGIKQCFYVTTIFTPTTTTPDETWLPSQASDSSCLTIPQPAPKERRPTKVAITVAPQ